MEGNFLTSTYNRETTIVVKKQYDADGFFFEIVQYTQSPFIRTSLTGYLIAKSDK